MSAIVPSNPMLEAFFAGFSPEAHPVIAHSTQGIIVHVRTGGLDMAVKTPTGRGPARWLHSMALRREYQAYRRLTGVDGFPECYGLYAGNYLALEYLDARPLKAATLVDREAFFRRLLQVIETMHASGVAHGDLKSKHNILVTTGERPIIVDLGTSVVKKNAGWHPVNNRLFNYMCRIDRNGWIKLKYRGYDRVGEADRHLFDLSLIERINRRLRRK